jgi:putative sigma-54 modulation protein
VDIVVRSKNCEVPSRVKDEAVEKVEHATRFFDRLLAIEMVFSEEHNPRIAEPALVELTARTKGHHIRAEGSGQDHRGAVDVAVARFERQLTRYKTRVVDRSRRAKPPLLNGQVPAETVPVGEAEQQARIVRTKRFALQPMLPEDAAWQLELLGHEFFLFSNAANGRCSVVYRRRDGDLGLIEAEEGPPA